MTRIAVIGNGRWGAHYLRLFNDLPGACVEIACDTDAARLPQQGARRFSNDWQAAVTDDRVDAVIVATPAVTHHEVALRALAAGKHVLVEKPMTTRVDHAEALKAEAERQSVVLMVGHTYLFHDGVERLAHTVNQPDFGALRFLKATRTHQGPVRTDVNAVWDLAAHDIAIFRRLLGRAPLAVSGLGLSDGRPGHEHFGLVRLWYEGDVEGQIHVSWSNPQRVREVVVLSGHSCAVFDECRAGSDVWTGRRGQPVHDVGVRDSLEPLRAQCAHFLACIEGERPRCPADVGIEVVRVLDAVSRSMRQQGAVTKVLQP